MIDRLAISLAQLILPRMRALGITRGDLARRMGYANIAKGCRRIDQICSWHVEMAENLRVALSRGLGVNVEVVDRAIDVPVLNSLRHRTGPIGNPSSLTPSC